MTKSEWLEFLEAYDDAEDISDYDINEFLTDKARAREEWIEELEERQHKSGFYEFQDRLYMWRMER